MKLTSQTSDYALEEVPGSQYQTVEQCQEALLEPLARLIAEMICQARLADEGKRDTIEPCPENFLSATEGFIEGPKNFEASNV
jgi:hypothetical protein